jgi:hypothetical protein
MKHTFRILFAVALALAARLTTNTVSAQVTFEETIATWSCKPLTGNNAGGPAPAPFTNNTVGPGGGNVIVSPITKGLGVGNTTGNDEYGGINFTNVNKANAITASNYISYTVQAAPGYTISFQTNYFFVFALTAGAHTNVLQYSADGVNYIDLSTNTIPAGNSSTTWTNNCAGVAQLQNVSSTVTNYFRIVAWGGTGASALWVIDDPPSGSTGVGANDIVLLADLTSPAVNPPTNLVVNPSSATVNVGQTVNFNVIAQGSPATYAWYFTNALNNPPIPVPNATNATLSLSNVLAGNSGGYFVIMTNISGAATSSIVSLTVNGDPTLQAGPNNTYGLVDGTVYFSPTVLGTGPITYQWYFVDGSSNVVAAVSDGSTTASGAVIYGSGTSLLSISNIQTSDLTNFIVVISNIYGKQTSSVVSILAVTNLFYDYPAPILGSQPPITPMVLWDFNGPVFTNLAINAKAQLSPAPYLGVGTAMPVGGPNNPGTSPFAGAADPNNGAGFDQIVPSLGDHLPNNSWGTSSYPLNGGPVNSNKQNGVQFNVSTVGAKNIFLSYDSRVSATASDYERVQYTTNGTTWIDYPSSSTFNNIGVVFDPFTNDFSGFPGVANNPNFGVRIVTEFQSTATYGIGPSNMFVGTGNTYSTAGTVTYDLVRIFGDSITNNNVPPVISPFTNLISGQVITNTTFETIIDNVPVTNTFFVSGDASPLAFGYSAVSLNPPSVNPGFAFTTNANGTCSLIITPNTVSGANLAAGPILVTVTDTKGDVTKSWFNVTLVSANPAPTNTLTSIPLTNTLVNTALPIAFRVGSQSNSVHQFTYTVSSANNTVVPSANIVVNTNAPANPTNPIVTITPANNQLGDSVISIGVNDNNLGDPKTTTATIPFMVRPNTNVIMIDYFNYDSSGALDVVNGGLWQHLSGNFHQLTVNSSAAGGSVTLDTLNNTENLDAGLIGAPYSFTNNTTLFYSFQVNLENLANMPNSNGTYVVAFNDGFSTADIEDLFVVGTNNAAPGMYRVGVACDGGATAAGGSTMIPVDLSPNSNYVVVTSLNLNTGKSTIWLNPTNQSSPSFVSNPDTSTIKTNINSIELRESGNQNGTIAGAVSLSFIKVGKTFNSVLQLPQIASAANYTVPFGSTFDVTLTNLAAVAGWFDPNNLILSVSGVDAMSFQGTNLTLTSTDIAYGGPVVNYDNFNYTINDGYFSVSGMVFLTPVLQMNGTQTLNGSRNPVITGTSPIGAAGYVYGMEYATNLLGQWFEAGNVTVQPSGAWSFTDTHQTNPPVIFYRIYYPDNPANPPQ